VRTPNGFIAFLTHYWPCWNYTAYYG